MSIRRRIFALALAAAACSSPAAFAQQPGTSADPAPQGADSGDGDGFIDGARRWAEKHQIVERLNGDVDGWYPRLGGMTRGSGIAGGPGYRLHVFGDRVLLDLSAGISTKAYKALDAKARWLQAFDGRLELWTDFRYEDYPQEDFFGIGADSTRETRTSYDLDGTNVTVRAIAKPVAWLRTGATLGYMRPDVGPGADRNYPSIEDLFTDSEAPGLGAQPDFVHTTFFGEIDRRDQRGYPRAGGFYRVSLGFFNDTTLHQFDHRRVDGEASHHVPLVDDKRHVLTGRVGFSYVNNETGERVPFYFLAYVGGVDTIRGYPEFRFKDENAFWINLEYRWAFIKWVSLATFVDAGEVRADWQDIGPTGLKTGYGFGFRVHSEKQVFARLDFGTGGGEGWQVFFKFGPAF